MGTQRDEEFEKAYSEICKPIIARPYPRNEKGDYIYKEIHEAYLMWQAKAQAVPEGFVLVRNELPESIAEQMAVDRTIKPSPERDPVWMEIAESAYKSNLLNKKWELYRDYKEMIIAEDKRLATFKYQERNTLDSKALKSAHPDIYEQFLKTSSTRVLRVA